MLDVTLHVSGASIDQGDDNRSCTICILLTEPSDELLEIALGRMWIDTAAI